MLACVIVVEESVLHVDGPLALAVYRIPGIDRQVEDRILDLHWMDRCIPETTAADGFNLNTFSESPA